MPAVRLVPPVPTRKRRAFSWCAGSVSYPAPFRPHSLFSGEDRCSFRRRARLPFCLRSGPLVASGPTAAAEADFLSRFEGSFSGGGTVQRNAQEEPNQVTCTLTGQPSETGISMSGKCGAFIFSKRISADLTFDEASGRYSGTYVGSSIGACTPVGQARGQFGRADHHVAAAGKRRHQGDDDHPQQRQRPARASPSPTKSSLAAPEGDRSRSAELTHRALTRPPATSAAPARSRPRRSPRTC